MFIFGIGVVGMPCALPFALLRKRQLTEVGDDDIRAMCSEVDGVIASSNTNHKPEPAGTPRRQRA